MRNGNRVTILLLYAMIFVLSSSALGQESAETIIQKSLAANTRDWNAAPQFDCREQDRTSKGGTKTYDDMMILGSPYQRLVAMNGKPLDSAQEAEENRKLKNAIAERKSESHKKRAARIAKYQAELKRNRFFMEQMTSAFDFKLVDETELDGHQVYVLDATPRHGYR
ncbi:MAG: hypothetical protein WCA99_06470, partial [Candidatus Sulfotelmatobacter sp.]